MSPLPPFSLKRNVIFLLDFEPAHHTAKIVPSGKYYLNDMDDEETYESHRDPEVFPTSHLIAAKNCSKPVQLSRFVNSEAGDEHAETHDDYGRIGDTLRTVVFCLGGQAFSQVEVYEGDLNCVTYASSLWEQEPPLPGDCNETHIGNAICCENPHIKEVVSEPLRDVEGCIDCLPEPAWEKTNESEVSNTDTIDRMWMAIRIV